MIETVSPIVQVIGVLQSEAHNVQFGRGIEKKKCGTASGSFYSVCLWSLVLFCQVEAEWRNAILTF
jgi:hypothetical protein